MTSRAAAAVTLGLFAAAAALSGCGRQGDLERPAPLFGAKAKQDYQEYQTRKKAGDPVGATPAGDAALARDARDNAGDDTDVVAPPTDTPATTPLPPRTAPISGSSPDPFGSRPQGALPDPYANPNRSQ